MSNSVSDFMHRAFEIANDVDPHQTSPNPRVGCIIVKDREIIAQGVHEKYGSFHAEQNAIKAAMISGLSNKNFKDSEIYITLEPCDHFHEKNTPSCTDLLIKIKPQKIFIGSLDLHFQGKNIEKIRQSGIEVKVLNDSFHKKLNPFFERYILTKKPYIALKIAQSLDGRITNKKKEEKLIYITNQKSLEKVHEMRGRYSIILTTTQTILSDNPRMNIRFGRSGVSDPDIVIVGKSKLSQDLKIFQTPNRIIYRFDTFQDFWESEEIKTMDSIMTECGSRLNTYLLENNFVDEINLFIAPKIIGSNNLKSFEQEISLKNFGLKEIVNLEGDTFISFIKKQT